MNNNFNFSSHKNSENNKKLVGKAKMSKEQKKMLEEKLKIEKARRKLEKSIEKKIEEANRKEEKQKAKLKKKNSKLQNINYSLNNTHLQSNSISGNDSKEKKVSLFKRFLLLRKKKKEAKLQKKKLKQEQERLKKEEKLQKKKQEKDKKTFEKEEKQRIKNQKIEQEKILKETQKKLSNQSNNESNKVINEKKLQRQEQKRIAKEKKEQERLRKEEEKKKKYKEKYEEEARKRREKEEKALVAITEKRERAKRLQKERDQARKERKEKALLIKKAKEESREKRRKERKTFKENFENWYNNLSFVRDSKNRKEMQRQTLLLDFEGEDAVRSEEKVMYKYVAKNNETGKIEKGMFAAFSKLDVHSFLLAEGYEVYEITPQTNFNKPITLFQLKLKSSELDFFLTQLSTFLKSGMTLVDSVKVLSKQTKKIAHKNIYKGIIYELTMGENFSEALAKQGTVFPRLLINMIKTSELTGDLPETLDDMADYYREIEKTKKQMVSALTYPAFVLCFAVVILIYIMVSVIPQFVSIYNDLGAGLPTITIVIINISNFLKTYWVYVVLGIFVFILVFILIYKSIKVFRSILQSLVMNLPIMGKIIIYNEVTMFTKTFASLLNHNVYITDCMEVLSKITNNEIYKMLIFDTITNLAKGEAISNSFKNHWAFPNIAYEMILTGEKTGQLGPMMDKVSRYYQELHKNAVNQIKAFIEPIMIIILAFIVGVILLSVVLPMFDMYQNIGV